MFGRKSDPYCRTQDSVRECYVNHELFVGMTMAKFCVRYYIVLFSIPVSIIYYIY